MARSSPTSVLLQQMDRAAIAAQKMARLAPVVPGGWLSTLRKSLGMPRRALAKRLKIHPTTLLASERGEVNGTITLAQLRRLAGALDCELVYALAPRTLPSATLNRKAQEIASAEMTRLFGSMALEKQTPTRSARLRIVAEYKERVLSRPRLIWK